MADPTNSANPCSEIVLFSTSMKQATAHIRQLEQLDSLRAEIHLECPPAARPEPGQFVLAGPGSGAYLLQPIFPRRLAPSGFTFETDLAAAARLQPGSRLDLLGPVGRAARPPGSARNLLLVHAVPGPLRLLPLALDFLTRSGAVALLFSQPDAPLAGLPDEFEILRGPLETHLPEPLAWADVVYLDAPAEQLDRLRQALAQARPYAGAVPAYALIAPPMPCGVGACGVCAVRTRKGWRHACVDGPLFSISDLEL